MIVAIDGPAGSGKGTVTKEIAKRIGLINLDTGATYRCVALEMLKEGVSLEETDKIIEISKNVDINLTEDKAAIEIWLRNAENENLCYYFFPYDAAIIEV